MIAQTLLGHRPLNAQDGRSAPRAYQPRGLLRARFHDLPLQLALQSLASDQRDSKLVAFTAKTVALATEVQCLERVLRDTRTAGHGDCMTNRGPKHEWLLARTRHSATDHHRAK